MPTSETPAEAYRRRLSQLGQLHIALQRSDRLFIALKVAAGVLTLVVAVWLAKDHPERIAYVLLPVVLLLVLFALHERTLTALRENARLRTLYEDGLERLADRWPSTGTETGEQFLPGSHAYARDLDLFGAGSLYHLLCNARTRIGKETLAAWLLTPAPLAEIVLRQAAVRELAPLLEFREQLALAGAALEERSRRTGAGPVLLADWGERDGGAGRDAGVDARLRWPAAALALLWAGAVVAWQWKGGWPWTAAALALTVVVRGFGSRFRARVKQAAADIEAATGDLGVLARVLRVMERQSFECEKLSSLQTLWQSSGLPPSAAIASLSRRIDWLASADNWFVKILDGFLFWRLQCVIAIEDWRRVHGNAVRGWLEAIGEMEALTAFSVYAYENPGDVYPEFVDEPPCFDAEGLAHPLLPRARAVRNSLRLDGKLQLMLISGPNMAGKSTFLRSVGVNAVLAQAGAPVRAQRLRMSRLNAAASICVLDSLQGGLSRFYAEILRLKEIDALSREEVPVLFLLDELLSGTNSHDRRAGTEAMVRSLIGRGAIGMVTTHDLALAAIADGLGGRAANYHFEDRYEEGQLYFEYKLTPGTVQTSNALELMRSIGLEV